MKKKTRYTAIVVGAGSIGAMKPDKFDSPKTKNVLTLAHAFYNHKDINLLGFVDIDNDKALAASKKWKAPYAYQSINQIPEDVDIVAVCVPTVSHITFFKDLLLNEKIPRIVMAEKPFCYDSKEAESVQKTMKALNIPVAINYTRRYDYAFQLLKEQIDKEILGEVYSCVVYYDRGLQRDGCHAIDICNYLFDSCLGGSILPGRRCNDYSDNDISYPVHLVYDKCENVFLVPCDGRSFSIFEIDIITEKVRLRFTDHGKLVEVYYVEKEKTYGDYNAISYDPIHFKTELTLSLSNYVQNVVDHLDGKAKLICNIDDAIRQHRIYESLIRRLDINDTKV